MQCRKGSWEEGVEGRKEGMQGREGCGEEGVLEEWVEGRKEGMQGREVCGVEGVEGRKEEMQGREGCGDEGVEGRKEGTVERRKRMGCWDRLNGREAKWEEGWAAGRGGGKVRLMRERAVSREKDKERDVMLEAGWERDGGGVRVATGVPISGY
jgi:hypothetical protein